MTDQRPITISTIKAAKPWNGELLMLPAGTIIDIDPESRKTRFTEPNGCRYLLKGVKYATLVPVPGTITVGQS